MTRTWTDPVYEVMFTILRCRFEQLEPWVVKMLGAGYTLTAPPPVARTIISPGAQEVVFWFPVGKVCPSSVAHEADHAAFEVLRSRGIKMKPAAEEAHAYYLGYLVREMSKRLR